MGLDISHNTWYGPYSTFHWFRSAIAAAVGLNLSFMEGFEDNFRIFVGAGGPSGRELHFVQRHVSWDVLKPDPLHTLLRHSDCDGEIAVEDLGGIYDRLVAMREDIIPWFRENEREMMTQRLDQFIEGLHAARVRAEPLTFR